MAEFDALKHAAELHAAGNFAEAEREYRRILAQDPKCADALNLLGVMAFQAGRFDDAFQLISRAIQLNPLSADFLNHLGSVLAALGRAREAIAAHQRAIELKPDLAEAHANLGAALFAVGDWGQSIASFGQAVALQPENPQSRHGLARSLWQARRFDEAIEQCRQAIALAPNSPDLMVTLALCLGAKGETDSAIEAYRKALALQPDRVDALNNMGNCLRELGQAPQAIECYQRALLVDPTRAMTDSQRLYTMHLCFEYDAMPIFQEHQIWNQRHAEKLGEIILPHANVRDPGRRLRVGYVSADFREHSLSRSFLPLLRQHDRSQFEIICYSSVRVADAMTEQLRTLANGWRDIGAVNDAAAAELIRADGVDILVDLSVHSPGNRLLVFARKPAPVQVTFLGYCSTTGIPAIEYRMSDPHLDPPETDLSCYSEQTYRLPGYWCYRPVDEVPPVSPLPAMSNGFITFGCLAHFSKVSRQALDIWALLLREVPRSRLLLNCPCGSARQYALECMALRGIGPNRVEFTEPQPWYQHMERFHRIDISLDSVPFCGGMSTCDSLWMGVPVVTLQSGAAVGRAGRSILSNVGLGELIASGAAQYLQIAVELASDFNRLASLRGKIREHMAASPLMDIRQYTRDVEEAYRVLWRRWCS